MSSNLTEVSGKFAGVNGVRISWRAYRSPDRHAPALIILNGRSEFMEKYADVVRDLSGSGYSLYLMDHRGQGESGRMLPESEKGHVEKYQDYLDDLGTFIRDVVRKDNPSGIHVLAHSMGGAIATAYEIQNPGVFASMILVAPMYRAQLGNYPELVALLISEFMRLIGKGEELAPGRTLKEWHSSFAHNHVTHSEGRFQGVIDLLTTHPDLALGGPTFSWVAEAIKLGRFVRREAGRLQKTPLLIFQAPDDAVVVNSVMNEVCAKARDCRLEPIAGAKHEILMEAEPYRSQAFAEIESWLKAHRASLVR